MFEQLNFYIQQLKVLTHRLS